MIVANMQTVEAYEREMSELRKCFFEGQSGMNLVSGEFPSLIRDLRILVAYEAERSKTVLGQALHFSSLLHSHQMDYGICLHETREVIEHAYDLHDVDMQVAALIQQGMLYSYQLLPGLRYSVFHRAMQLLDKVASPLIRACLLYGYAESVAASGQVELDGVQRYFEAERHFERAEAVSVPDDDPGRLYFWQSSVTRDIYRARFFVAHRRCLEAVELLLAQMSRWNATPENIEALDATPANVEMLFILAQAYCHMVLRRQGEDAFGRACFFIEALVDASRCMESRLYHSQAQIIYEFLMLSKWHREVSQCLSQVVAF